ncbi:hypothetical protein [Dactylosporangium sp. NPDC048998]|uniref:hypothetical protein n=1 Tax=Dactylosporangium sp. NPDC048998 TaxID=3363976 RepID=UPI0037180114
MDLQDAGCHARFLIRDRDGKYPALFDTILADTGIQVVLSGIQMPRMNTVMERWIQSCRRELLDRTLVWNQPHLLHTLREYEPHHHPHRLPRLSESAGMNRHGGGDGSPPGPPRLAPHPPAGRTLAPEQVEGWVATRYFSRFNKSRQNRWVFGDRGSGAYLTKVRLDKDRPTRPGPRRRILG